MADSIKYTKISEQIRALISHEAKNDEYRTEYRVGRDEGLEAAAVIAEEAEKHDATERNDQ